VEAVAVEVRERSLSSVFNDVTTHQLRAQVNLLDVHVKIILSDGISEEKPM